MAIDRNLNLIYTIDRGEDPAPRVFAIPVGQAIFDIYYRVLARTYVEIYGDRLQIAGAKIAVNMLRDVAKATPRMDGSGTWWEGPDGVEAGFLGAVRRQMTAFAPAGGEWQQLMFDDAVKRGLIDEKEAAAALGAVVFFTVVWLTEEQRRALPLLERAGAVWGWRLTSSPVSDLRKSLPTLTPAEPTGAKATASSTIR